MEKRKIELLEMLEDVINECDADIKFIRRARKHARNNFNGDDRKFIIADNKKTRTRKKNINQLKRILKNG